MDNKDQAISITKKVRDKNNSTFKSIKKLEETLVRSRIKVKGGHIEHEWATECLEDMNALRILNLQLNEKVLMILDHLNSTVGWDSDQHEFSESLGIRREYIEEYGIERK